MFNRISRWNWLGCFALANLFFWIGVAIGVGLLVTDTLDLGVESFIRDQHATAIVAWDRISLGRPSATGVNAVARTLPATIPPGRPTAQPTVQPGTMLSALSTATSVAWPTTVPTRAVEPTVEMAIAAGPTRTSIPSPQVQKTAIRTPTAVSPTATPQPTETLLSSPLLVSDPDVGSMANIDAEMAHSAPGRPVQIRYDEATLNRQVAAALASYPDLPYQNLQLDLERDEVVVKGNVTVMGFQVKAEVHGTVVAQNCMPQAEISKISIAGLLTPGFVRDSIEKMIADSLSWYPPDYPLCVEQIVLEKDRVTIYGSRR